jgi:hypothetical protein
VPPPGAQESVSTKDRKIQTKNKKKPKNQDLKPNETRAIYEYNSSKQDALLQKK